MYPHFLKSFDKNLLLLFFLPILILIINDAWCFNRTGFIDPWLYLGFGLEYPRYVGDWFPQTYYGSRLCSILPSFIWHKLLPSMVANYANHLTITYVALYSLYYTLRYHTDRFAALTTSSLMSCYVWFAASVGWDYTDGFGIAYQLLSIALLTKAIFSERSRWWIIASGGAAAAMVHSHLFLFFFCPVFAIYYLLFEKNTMTTSFFIRFVRFSIFFSLGALLLTLALGVVNNHIGGRFLFFMPSVKFGSTLVVQKNQYLEPISGWLPKAKYLLLPFITFFLSIIYVMRTLSSKTWNSFQFSTAVSMITMFMFFLLWQAIGQPFLQLYFYASSLMPLSFMVICGLIFNPPGHSFLVEGAFQKKIIGITAILISFFLTSGWLIGLNGFESGNSFLDLSSILTPVSSGNKSCPIWVYTTMLSIPLILVRVLRPKWCWSFAMGTVGIGLVTFSSGTVFADFKHAPRDTYRLVVDEHRRIAEHSVDRRPTFWYSNSEPMKLEYIAIASTYLWGYSLLNDDFPKITPDQGKLLSTNSRLVVISINESDLSAAQENLRQLGLDSYIQAKYISGYADDPFTIWFLDLEQGRPLTFAHPDDANRLKSLILCSQGPAPSLLCQPFVIDLEVPGAEAPSNEGVTFTSLGKSKSQKLADFGYWEIPETGNYVFKIRFKEVEGNAKLKLMSDINTTISPIVKLTSVRSGIVTINIEFHLKKGDQFAICFVNESTSSKKTTINILELVGWLK